jgi:hypothetical protein
MSESPTTYAGYQGTANLSYLDRDEILALIAWGRDAISSDHDQQRVTHYIFAIQQWESMLLKVWRRRGNTQTIYIPWLMDPLLWAANWTPGVRLIVSSRGYHPHNITNCTSSRFLSNERKARRAYESVFRHDQSSVVRFTDLEQTGVLSADGTPLQPLPAEQKFPWSDMPGGKSAYVRATLAEAREELLQHGCHELPERISNLITALESQI